MLANKIEELVGGELAKEYQALPPEEKEKLSWKEKQFLSAEERAHIAKNSLVEFGTHKFKCKPFTLGLFVQISEVIEGVFGRPTSLEQFSTMLPMILDGENPHSRLYLKGELYNDIINIGEEPEKFKQGEALREAVDFFCLHYFRTGTRLRQSAPDLAPQLQPQVKEKPSHSKSRKGTK